jgi:hemolysin activation/secretion protein
LPNVVSQERLRQLERERVLRESREVRPEVRLSTPAAAPVAPAVAMEGAGCFPVERVELWGDLAERFQFSLELLMARPYLTSPARRERSRAKRRVRALRFVFSISVEVTEA